MKTQPKSDEQFEADCVRLREILTRMGVPARRRELTESNLLWMGRNLGISFAEHPDFAEAMRLIKETLAEYALESSGGLHE